MELMKVFTFLGVVAVALVSGQELGPLSYDQLNQKVKTLCDAHKDVCKLSIAQEVYNLPSPGMCGKEKNVPCVTQIVHITNFSTYEQEKQSRPQIYISGELHGDERVGPHAAVEYIRLLLESDNPWIKRLVNTRSIFLTPITNSLGFDRNTRQEGAVDPNRDYPIDQSADNCMKAISSRIANELYRAHMFQLAITFHGGMEAIAMEWGTTSRLNSKLHKSPDDFALLQMGGALSNYAGAVSARSRKYPVGRMNDLVYPVEGGMEDWAYAGSWDPESKRVPCSPDTFGGYPTSKTQYTDDMLRTVNILVETSDRKWPEAFGTPANILDANSGTGHVPRNVRLALMLTDVVEPYVLVTSTNYKNGKIKIYWEVGGAFEVDSTWAELKLSSSVGQVLKTSSKLTGKTRWATNTYNDRAKWPFKPMFSTCFTIPDQYLSDDANTFVVQVHAKVDSAWAMAGQSDSVSPKGYAPQTHVVNARTNPNWDRSNAGFRIKGKTQWSSEPVRIERKVPPPVKLNGRLLRSSRRLDVGDNIDEDENEVNVADEDTDVIHTAECEISAQPVEARPRPDESNPDVPFVSFSQNSLAVFSAIAFLMFSIVAIYMWRTRNAATHQQLAVVDEDS